MCRCISDVEVIPTPECSFVFDVKRKETRRLKKDDAAYEIVSLGISRGEGVLLLEGRSRK